MAGLVALAVYADVLVLFALVIFCGSVFHRTCGTDSTLNRPLGSPKTLCPILCLLPLESEPIWCHLV